MQTLADTYYAGNTLLQTQSNKTEKIIKELNLKNCRCSKYIEEENDLCGCGRPLELHDSDIISSRENEETWNIHDHTCEIGIADYGLIKFKNSRNRSKYIRVSHRTDPNSLLRFIYSAWNLHQPDLIISITGSAQNYNVSNNLRNALHKGLVKISIGTNTWVITGGCNAGIMKDIGEVLRDNVAALDPNKSVVLIGIANWATLRNNHKLVRTNNKHYVVDYSMEPDIDNKEQQLRKKEFEASLDNNHTHFILVDDTRMNHFGGEVKLRGKLQKEISEEPTRQEEYKEKKDKIPCILIVVGGGPVTFENIRESVANDHIPCIFIENSGRCADCFVYAYKQLKNKQEIKKTTDKEEMYTMASSDDKIIDEELKGKILDFMKKNLEKTENPKESAREKENRYLGYIEVMRKIFEYPHMLSIFTNDDEKDLDETILYSILKSRKEENKLKKEENQAEEQKSLQKQLNLALLWNRIDIAKKYILEEKTWESKFFNSLMYLAITKDRVDFVREFLNHGLVLSKFLTYRRLLKLYNDIPNKTNLYSMLFQMKIKSSNRKQKTKNVYFTFKDIGLLTQSLLDHFFKHKLLRYPFDDITDYAYKRILAQTDNYGKCPLLSSTEYYDLDLGEFTLEDNCQNAEHELFMYAILSGRFEMAKIFLKEGRNELCSSLIASKIYKSFSTKYDKELNRNYAKFFEEVAISVLDLAYKANPENARLLLIREVPQFGNSTCLQIAKIADDQTFLAHPCVQELLVRLWFNRLSAEQPMYKILLCLPVPFLVPKMLRFREARSFNRKYLKIENKEDEQTHLAVDSHSGRLKNRINLNEDEDLGYFRKIYEFLKAPVVKFAYDKLMYLAFLIIFSYVILCDFKPITEYPKSQISPLEILLIIWVFSFLVEKFHRLYVSASSILITKVRHFFEEFWNIVEFSAIVLFIIAYAFRFIPYDYNYYLTARVLLSIDILLWYFKSLHIYVCFRVMGPKLIMIRKMLTELISFISIVVVFIFAFGISTQAMMYHNLPLDKELLKNVFYPAFFVIGGEYYTDDTILGADTCVVNDTSREQTDRYSQDDCPEKNGANVTLFVYTFYLVFLNILLLNLLISIFGKTYNKIQNESDNVWKFQRYALIYEYFHKPGLLSIFMVCNLFSYMFQLLAQLLKMVFFRNLKPSKNNILKRIFFHFYQQYNNGFKIFFESEEQKRFLIRWENQLFDMYSSREEEKEREKLEFKLQENSEKLDRMNKELRKLLAKKKKEFNQVNEVERVLDKLLDDFNSRKKL